MNVLVTGGAGFIGSNLVDLLIGAGHEVTVIDNLSTGKAENIHPQAQFLQKDITNRTVWKTMDKHDMVFHTAALARIQPSIKDPVPGHDANVTGTLNVLEYCRKQKSKLIFSSSSSIYKEHHYLTPTHEESDLEPKNPYALQKHICEQYIELYGELYGLNYVILRYFNVYGERQLTDGAYTTVLGIFLKQKSEGAALTITSDGEQRRDFTYVGDVARANLMAMNWQGIFNIGASHNYSVNEIADFVGGERKYIPERPGEVRRTLANNGRARRAGWRPTVDIKDWIQYA